MQLQFLSNTDFSLAKTDDSYIKLVGRQPRKNKKYSTIQKNVWPAIGLFSLAAIPVFCFLLTG